MDPERTHKGWTEADLRRVLPAISERAQDIIGFIAMHPGCTTTQMAAALPIKSERSVGKYLDGLTRAARDAGVNDRGTVRWPFEYLSKHGNYERYDMPPWVRSVVLDVLGET